MCVQLDDRCARRSLNHSQFSNAYGRLAWSNERPRTVRRSRAISHLLATRNNRAIYVCVSTTRANNKPVLAEAALLELSYSSGRLPSS